MIQIFHLKARNQDEDKGRMTKTWVSPGGVGGLGLFFILYIHTRSTSLSTQRSRRFICILLLYKMKVYLKVVNIKGLNYNNNISMDLHTSHNHVNSRINI